MNGDALLKRRKTVFAVIAVLWGVLTFFAIMFFIVAADKALVQVKYAPFAAVVKLDDTVIMNNNENFIAPGEYHLVVEYENFETYEADIVVGDNTTYMYRNLKPINDEGERYMHEHAEEFLEVQGIAGMIATEEGTNQIKEYPVIEQLPIRDSLYMLDYTVEDGKIVITVSAGLGYRGLAIDGLMDLIGEDGVGKYDVKIVDLDNPYEGKFVENDEKTPDDYLKAGYANVGFDFTVGGGEIEGDYYYAFLRYYFQKYVGVVFKVVLRREGDGWKLAGEPYPILTTANTPGVPLEIIEKANQL